MDNLPPSERQRLEGHRLAYCELVYELESNKPWYLKDGFVRVTSLVITGLALAAAYFLYNDIDDTFEGKSDPIQQNHRFE